MLKISRLADYATIIMRYLAEHNEQRFSAAALAKQLHIGLATVSKILKLLQEACLLTATRGTNGGYQLACDAKEITVARIVMAIEGRPAMTQCSEVHNRCQHLQDCRLRGNWQFINNIIYEVLNSVSLQDMCRPLEHSFQLGALFSSKEKMMREVL